LHQSLRTVRLPAIRGKILDRNGLPLVLNEASYNINLYLEELRDLFRAEYSNRVRPQYLHAKSPSPTPLHSRSPVRLADGEDAELQRQARVRVVSNIVAEVSGFVNQPPAFDEKRFHRHYENARALPWPILERLTQPQVARFAARSV